MRVDSIVTLVLSGLMAVHGFRKKSLSLGGAVTGFLVGLITGQCGGLVFFLTLFTFYYTSSRLTKYQQGRKKEIEDDFKEGGQREPIQVLSNSFMGCCAAVAWWYYSSLSDAAAVTSTLLSPFARLDLAHPHSLAALAAFSFVAHYACCAGDTWASEIGILSSGEPFLITNLRRVPRGTNGGISSLGLGASIAGGACVGLSFSLLFAIRAFGTIPPITITPSTVAVFMLKMMLFGAASGLVGSLVDSLLGATLQSSSLDLGSKKVVSDGRKGTGELKHISGWNVLDNHLVNLLSSTITGLVMPAIVILVTSFV